MNIRLIRAFIASPGGLEGERKAAFAAAEEVNRSVAMPLGGRLELIGWEETLSGTGRPQAIINADMETCELFVGAMSTRWGSHPSLDGPFTSGFEEEFELSRERHRRTNSPIMAMFFKEIEPLQLADPGDELQKVLTFQTRLRDQKNFLYVTFSTKEEFAARVREFLSTHVIRMLKDTVSPRQERSVEVEPRQDSTNREVDKPARESAPDADFLIETAALLKSEIVVPELQVARLRLIASVIGGEVNDKQVLGIHDANLLYHERGRFDFVSGEKRGLLRAGLSQISQENVPVWSWIMNLTRQHSDLILGITAFGDASERVGAITVARLLQIPVQPLSFLKDRTIEEFWFQDDTPSVVKVAALRYLREHGTTHQLETVKREVDLAATETLSGAIEAAVAILLREDGQDAIRYVVGISFESIDSNLLQEAIRYLGELNLEDLTLALDHRSPHLRAAALTTLSERGVIDLATIERAKDDDSPMVRLAALESFETLGQQLSLDEAYKVMARPRPVLGFILAIGQNETTGIAMFERYRAARLRSMPQKKLETLLGASSHREAAYFTLAARGLGDFHQKLRADLHDGFQTYFDQNWPRGIQATQSALTSVFSLGTSDPTEIKKRELVRAGLDIVAAQQDASDLKLVRDILDRDALAPSIGVISYLRTTGGSVDIGRLARASRYSSFWPHGGGVGHDFDAAANAILKLKDKGFEELILQDIPETMRARLIDLTTAAEIANLSDEQIVKLLLSSEPIVRRSMARKVPMSVARGRVIRLLAAYRTQEEGRYYVVTHWLDLGIAYSRATARKVVTAEA